MLPKNNTADRKTVEEIFKKGRFLNSTNLSLKFFIDSEKKGITISCITPKTASKKAVVRNLLRRRGYVVIKKHLQSFPTGFTGALVFGKKSNEAFGGVKTKLRSPIQNLEHEFNSILSKIR